MVLFFFLEKNIDVQWHMLWWKLFLDFLFSTDAKSFILCIMGTMSMYRILKNILNLEIRSDIVYIFWLQRLSVGTEYVQAHIDRPLDCLLSTQAVLSNCYVDHIYMYK